MTNRKFKTLSTYQQAHKIAKEEIEKRYSEIFSECAADVTSKTRKKKRVKKIERV